MRLTNEQLDYLRDLCVERFKYFCQALIGPEWFDEEFHGRLCDFLQAPVPLDKCVVMPRTHLKTTIAATLFPLWKAVCDPSIRVLITGNSSTNASKTVHAIRAIIESNTLFQALFPEVIPDFRHVRWSDECACVNRPVDHPEGTFESAGIGANIIRRHYNLIVEDDTVAPKRDELSGSELMPSRDEIEKAVGFHKLTIPLLITADADSRVYIGTRWAAYDVISHIMEEEAGGGLRSYAVMDTPALDGEGRPAYKRFSADTLHAIEGALGTYMFAALYMNKPLSSEQMVFRPEWTTYYTTPPRVGEGRTVVTVDPADAPTGKRKQCYTAIVAARGDESGLYVLEYVRERVPEGTVVAHSLDVAERWEADTIRMEVDRYANLEQAFRNEMNRRGRWFAIDAVKTRGRKKEARILRLVPLAQAHRLFIRKGMGELESEMYQFPNGATMDLVDALAWQVVDLELEGAMARPALAAPKPRASWSWEHVMRSCGATHSSGATTPYPFGGGDGGLVGRFQ